MYVRRQTCTYVHACMCDCVYGRYIHTYIHTVHFCMHIHTYSTYVSRNLLMVQLKEFASCCQNEGGNFVNVHCARESL